VAAAERRDNSHADSIDALAEAGEEAQKQVDEAIEEARSEFSGELEELGAQVRAVVERYQPLIERLNRRMARELESAYSRQEEVRQQIEDRLEELMVNLPDYPESEVEDPYEDEHYLYDSSRDDFEQMRHYRRRQGREDEWDAVVEALGYE
jgi:seryl-tRNA synthetase